MAELLLQVSVEIYHTLIAYHFNIDVFQAANGSLDGYLLSFLQ